MGTKVQTLYFPLRSISYFKSGTAAPVTSYGGNVATAVRTRTGTTMPNWREVIARGENATTAMSAQWDVLYYVAGKVDTRRKLYDWVNGPAEAWGEQNLMWVDVGIDSNYPYRTGPTPTMSTAYADNQARVKFYKKLRQQSVQFSAPTFLGELRETLHMIRRPANALYSKSKGYLDALSKAKRTNPKDWTKRVSGLWLEHSFGWIPLLHDAEEAQKALARLVTGASRKSLISGSYSDIQDLSSSLPSDQRGQSASSVLGANASFIHFRRHHQLHEKVIVRYKAKVHNQVEMTPWDNWALFGFTPSELVPTAWELLPWSFLVDYFVNVGDVLSSAITDSSRVAFVNKTVIREALKKGIWLLDVEASRNSWNVPWYTETYIYSVGQSPEFEHKRRMVQRSAAAGVPLPTLMLHKGLSDGKLFNIAALLGQARALHQQNPIRPFRR